MSTRELYSLIVFFPDCEMEMVKLVKLKLADLELSAFAITGDSFLASSHRKGHFHAFAFPDRA